MIINVGKAPTRIQYVNRGDLIFNTGAVAAYVDTTIANVIQAPQSSAIPVLGGATVQWAGTPGMLYGADPTGNAPGIGVTAHSGLPFPAPVGGTLKIRFFNQFGAILMIVDPVAGGIFQYQDLGSAAQGPLIGAQVSKTTQDPVFPANTIQAGVNVIDPVFGDFMQIVGATIFMGIGGAITRNVLIKPQQAPANNQGPYLRIDAPEQTTAKHLQTLLLGASPDGTRASQQVIAEVAAGGLLTPQTIETLEVQGNIATNFFKSIFGGVEAPWHIVSNVGEPPFLNSFTAGGTAPRFQFMGISGGRVRLSGAVNTGAVNAAGAAIFTLPAGYRPARTINFVTQNNITAYTLGSGSVQVVTTGDVQVVPATTAGKFVLLDGIEFELD